MSIIEGGRIIEGARKRTTPPINEGAHAGAGFKIAKATYDFAVDGGAIGDINLLAAADIPSGAVIVDAMLHVETILASAGAATAAIKVESAADINAADAFNGAPWSSTGFKRMDYVPAANGVLVKTTAARNAVLSIGAAALTGGKFHVYMSYVEV